jgi:glycosyltransferase involved in cell wall biosynthesis
MSTIFIGMPAYNGERFIREAIESLRQQTFSDWTLLIADDCSTDQTAIIAQEFARLDSRISYTRHSRNMGIFPNYKFTLEKADADSPYFMWAAQDDIWEKEYLAVCLDHLKNLHVGLATTCNETIDSFGRKVLESPWMTELSGTPGWRQVARYILQPEPLGKNNLMYSVFRTDAAKATWRAYPQRAVWGQDYMFSLAVISRYGVTVDQRILFKKRLGGYSSPQYIITDPNSPVSPYVIGNPKDHIFPFGRFKSYFSGHMEALRGTPYQSLGAMLLLARLPRSLANHIRERSLKNFLRRKYGNIIKLKSADQKSADLKSADPKSS